MRSGKIYFLRRADGLIKIGYSANFPGRLEALAKSHGALEVVRLLNGDQHREKRLHGQLAKHHEFGEWFRDSAELRAEIAALPDGSVVDIAQTAAEREWIEGEGRMVAEARAIIARLLQSRRQWAGLSNDEAFKALAADYRIREWLIRNIHNGRATTVTAHTMKVLTEALPVELLRHREYLLAAVEAAEAGRPLP